MHIPGHLSFHCKQPEFVAIGLCIPSLACALQPKCCHKGVLVLGYGAQGLLCSCQESDRLCRLTMTQQAGGSA